MIEVYCDDACKVRRIRETFPETPNTAVAVAKAESGLRTDAYNPEAHGNVCHGSIGVFQLSCEHARRGQDLKDFETNLKIARELYVQNGWKPWGAFTDGNFKRYLD